MIKHKHREPKEGDILWAGDGEVLVLRNINGELRAVHEPPQVGDICDTPLYPNKVEEPAPKSG